MVVKPVLRTELNDKYVASPEGQREGYLCTADVKCPLNILYCMTGTMPEVYNDQFELFSDRIDLAAIRQAYSNFQ